MEGGAKGLKKQFIDTKCSVLRPIQPITYFWVSTSERGQDAFFTVDDEDWSKSQLLYSFNLCQEVNLGSGEWLAWEGIIELPPFWSGSCLAIKFPQPSFGKASWSQNVRFSMTQCCLEKSHHELFIHSFKKQCLFTAYHKLCMVLCTSDKGCPKQNFAFMGILWENQAGNRG